MQFSPRRQSSLSFRFIHICGVNEFAFAPRAFYLDFHFRVQAIKDAMSALALLITVFVFSLYLTRKSLEIKISFSREPWPREHASYNKKDVTIKES